jgi:transcription-repair coupling factor (superfamily II helicase)
MSQSASSMLPPAELAAVASPLAPPLPAATGERLLWGRLYGAAAALAIANAATRANRPILAAVPDMPAAERLREALGFFLDGADCPVLTFPDWETLPYDVFSPLPELVSERLLTLHRLPALTRGVLVVPVATLLQRLPPRSFIDGHALVLGVGDRLDLDATRARLTRSGYQTVSQVIAHGELAVRGALLDVFPMGSQLPLRIDLFDDEIESIRTFDPDSQRSLEKLTQVRMLPAREYPTDEEGIAGFRQRWRATIDADPKASIIYREVSEGRMPGGIEYYLPLFFDETATLFDYLPDATLAFEHAEVRDAADDALARIEERYEQRRHDAERPLLPPARLYLSRDDLAARLNDRAGVCWQSAEVPARRKGYGAVHNFDTATPPALSIQARTEQPAAALKAFLEPPGRRTLLIAESTGRRELLLEALAGFRIQPKPVAGWQDFLTAGMPVAITVAPLEQPLVLPAGADELAIITETQLYGERVRQERRRKTRAREGEAVVRNLTELHEGSPVVHEEHGVGRFLGLQTIAVGGQKAEFLALEYAKGDKLYVPVSSLHLISRYTGAAPENAPLHRLGSDLWDKVKRKAAQKAYDVAAELLDIYARRAAREGIAFPDPGAEYIEFAGAFEFEETPDQQRAIDAIMQDMADPKPMDRVVCGDVGFGKTEVAMRAAFVAVSGGRQVAVLVPTTLLAQQHYQNFADRFADWPVKVESLSRFRTPRRPRRSWTGWPTAPWTSSSAPTSCSRAAPGSRT